jgi:hypothetical protein
MASGALWITRIAAGGTSFSLLLCQAWHNYMATNAHRVEVKVGADVHASAPLSGATVVAPPAGAVFTHRVCKITYNTNNHTPFLTICIMMSMSRKTSPPSLHK